MTMNSLRGFLRAFALAFLKGDWRRSEMAHRQRPRHRVVQRADGVDRDADVVAALEGEGLGRDDAGAGEEVAAVREAVVAEEPVDQLLEAALHLRERRRAGKHHLPR